MTRAKTPGRITWTWGGEEHWATVKPWNWGAELQAIRECSTADGIDIGEFVTYYLQTVVDASSASLTDIKVHANDPDFMWEAAKRLGALERLRRIGVRILARESTEDAVRLVVQEYLIVEHRLKRLGYTVNEYQELTPEAVQELLDAAEVAAEDEYKAIAERLAPLVTQRMGI